MTFNAENLPSIEFRGWQHVPGTVPNSLFAGRLFIKNLVPGKVLDVTIVLDRETWDRNAPDGRVCWIATQIEMAIMAAMDKAREEAIDAR